MEKFCKLFETNQGQILVKIDRNDDGNPEVRLWAQPEGLGVCSIASGYDDNDEGWDKAEEWFSRIDEAKAIEATRVIFQMAEEDSE